MLELDLERIIFINLFKNASYRGAVLPYLKPEYFTTPQSLLLFEIFSGHYEQYAEPPEFTTVVLDFKKRFTDKEELMEHFEYFKSIISISVQKNTEWLLKETEGWCKERALYQAIQQAISLYSNPKSDILDIKALPDLLNKAININFQPKLGCDYFGDAAQRWERYTQPAAKLPCTISTLNQITNGGVEPKTFNIILGKVHGGKTLTLVALGAEYLRAGFDVQYFTLEMSEESILTRFDMNLLRLSKDDIKGMTKEEFAHRVEEFKKNNPNIGQLKVKEYYSGTATATDFGLYLDHLETREQWKPKIILVDYIGLMRSINKYASANTNYLFKEIATELRAFAGKYEAAVWSAHQFNREGQNNDDPVLTNIADAISIGEVADFILALLRTPENDAQGKIMYKQLKNRYADMSFKEKFLLNVNFQRMQLSDVYAHTTQEHKMPPMYDPIMGEELDMSQYARLG